MRDMASSKTTVSAAQPDPEELLKAKGFARQNQHVGSVAQLSG